MKTPTLSQNSNGVWYVRDAAGMVMEAYHAEFDAVRAYERALRFHEFKSRLDSRDGGPRADRHNK